jgi:hypothetical protein
MERRQYVKALKRETVVRPTRAPNGLLKRINDQKRKRISGGWERSDRNQ